MSNSIANIIREGRIAAGLTQQALADRLKVSRAAIGQWESGIHEPSTDNLIKVFMILGVDMNEMKLDRGMGEQAKDQSEHSPSGNVINEMSAAASIKVLGAIGTAYYKRAGVHDANLLDVYVCHTSSNDNFTFISESPFTKYPRPLAILKQKDAYAVILSDDYLSPKYEMNDILYVDPELRPRNGDYVVVKTGVMSEMCRPDGSEGIQTEKCYFGRLVSFDLFGVKLMHHSPARTFTVDVKESGAVHRVYPYTDLILTGV